MKKLHLFVRNIYGNIQIQLQLVAAQQLRDNDKSRKRNKPEIFQMTFSTLQPLFIVLIKCFTLMDMGYSHAEICFNTMIPVSSSQLVLEISLVPPSHLREVWKRQHPHFHRQPQKGLHGGVAWEGDTATAQCSGWSCVCDPIPSFSLVGETLTTQI